MEETDWDRFARHALDCTRCQRAYGKAPASVAFDDSLCREGYVSYRRWREQHYRP